MTILTNEMIDVFCIVNREATIAQVNLCLDLNNEFIAEGVSKRDPIDEHDPEIAVLLAYGRAFEQLGKKLQKKANSLTKHKDDVRSYKEKQLEETLTPGNKVKKLPAKSAARKAKVAAKK